MSRAFRAAFREWFGLRPAEADLLVILYGAAGEFVARPAIAELAGVRGGSVNVHICHLRASLEAEAIDSAPRRGYRLTEQGMAECRGALWTMGEELRTGVMIDEEDWIRPLVLLRNIAEEACGTDEEEQAICIGAVEALTARRTVQSPPDTTAPFVVRDTL